MKTSALFAAVVSSALAASPSFAAASTPKPLGAYDGHGTLIGTVVGVSTNLVSVLREGHVWYLKAATGLLFPYDSVEGPAPYFQAADCSGPALYVAAPFTVFLKDGGAPKPGMKVYAVKPGSTKNAGYSKGAGPCTKNSDGPVSAGPAVQVGVVPPFLPLPITIQ